jgi:hypothetical protein
MLKVVLYIQCAEIEEEAIAKREGSKKARKIRGTGCLYVCMCQLFSSSRK